jgi:hypothetical protein
MKGLRVTLVPVKLPFGWLRLLPPLPGPLLLRLTDVSSNEAVSGWAMGGACCAHKADETTAIKLSVSALGI